MGIYDKKITGSNGINYTKEVDGPSDWGGIPYNTYFKDLSDGLIYFRNSGGAVIAIYELGGSGGGAATGGTVTTNYATLTGLISSNSLVPGVWYQFPYSTKHLIGGTTAEYNDTSVHYDDGTAVKSTLVPETETLSVLALSGNVIHVEAKSTQYPNDIIYYDVNDNLTEDGNQPRPGFITYREDTVNNISAHYDWRNVIHRRFDMDTTSARTADFRVMENYNSNSNYHHNLGITISDMIPKFSNFNYSGNTNIGALNTPLETTYRDFKTFVGLDTNLYDGSGVYGSPSTKGRYLNIHIKNSHSQARIIGSGNVGSGIYVTNENVLTSNLYGNIANVVFFTRSAENVTIGKNASGVMVIGKTIKELKIGDNNENIIIGGKTSGPFYTSTTATTKNYGENITIGNNNRNVSVAPGNRRLTIGNNNTNVSYMGQGTNNTLGSYNTLVFSRYSDNNNLGDWMTNIRISQSSNITIESECQDIDLVWNGAGANGEGLYQSTPATFPDGFNTSSSLENNMNSASASYIGDRGSNIWIRDSYPFQIESQAKDIVMFSAAGAKIGVKSRRISLLNTRYTTIGSNVRDAEIMLGYYMNVGDGCTGIKVVDGEGVGISNIGINCSNIGFFGSGGFFDIGDACSNVFISGQSTKVKIGDFNNDIIVRASSYTNIGNSNTEVFLEGSNYNNIGNNNTNISLADVGMIFKPGFPSFENYTWIVPNPYFGKGPFLNESDNTIEHLTGNTSPYGNATSWITSLGSKINGDYRGSNYTNIGNNCSEIFIVKSNNCVIGDNTSNVDIGCKTDSGSTYTLGNVSGYMNTVELTGNTGYNAITAATTTFGQDCHENVLGSNNNNINIRGINQSGNTFGDNVTRVEAVSGFTFTNNRVLVDGVQVTTSASYNNKVFDKNTSSGARWEETRVNPDTTSGLLVVGNEYLIKEYIPATGGTLTVGKTYEILDMSTATGGTLTVGQTYKILEIATSQNYEGNLSALTIGQTYKIIQRKPGDDFTNVGALSNASGTVFTATGTSPADWTHYSKLTVDDFTNVGSSANEDNIIFTATGTTPYWTNGSKLTADDFTNVGASENADNITFTATGTTPYWNNGSIVAVDDFTNVGATSNNTNITFIATGTTPNNWVNSSVLSNLESFTASPITRLK